MPLFNTFHHFWTREIDKIEAEIQEGKTLAICGIYGIGKNILTDIIVEKLNSNDTKIIRVSLKDLPNCNRQNIFRAIAQQINISIKLTPNFENDFDFHYFLREIIKNNPKTKYIFIFEESQNLLNLPDSFFESFESLRYYIAPNVSLLFFGQPQIFNFPTKGFNHLIKNNYIFLKPFNPKTTEFFIKEFSAKLKINLSFHNLKSITKLSQGHLGNIKFLIQSLKKAKFANCKINQKTFQEMVKEEPLMNYWIKNEINTLNKNQQTLITEFINETSGRLQIRESLEFQNLVNFGIFQTHGEKITFLYGPFKEILKKYFEIQINTQTPKIYLKNDQIMFYENSINNLFNYQEQQALKGLIENQILTYEALAQILWGTKWEEKYSLWAINKIISRLRKKLLELGVNAPRIQTISKQGYKLII